MASLRDFISRINTDGTARSNRFLVTINNPAVNDTDVGRLTSLYCEQTSLPGLTIASQPVRTFGEQREVVYDRTFDTINLNFILDRQFKVKSYFDAWMNRIIDPNSRLVGYYSSYATEIRIRALDVQSSAMYETILYEAYPKTIGAVALDSNSKDIARLQVTFAYKYHINSALSSVKDPDSEWLAKMNLYRENYEAYQYEAFNAYQNEIVRRNQTLDQLERQGIQVGRGLAANSRYTE